MEDYSTLFDDEDFIVEHIFQSPENKELIKTFSVSNDAKGLELYLKEVAETEEIDKQARTYLIKDRYSGELACYFSLRTGLVTLQVSGEDFDSLSAIKLSNCSICFRIYRSEYALYLCASSAKTYRTL